MNKFLLVISLFAFNGFAQESDVTEYVIEKIYPLNKKIGNLNYRTQIDKSHYYFRNHLEVHSGIKPFIVSHFGTNEDKFLPRYRKNIDNHAGLFRLYTIADLSVGVEVTASATLPLNTGIGAGLDFHYKKFVLTAKALPYYSNPSTINDSVQSTFNQDFGTGRALASNVFMKAEILANYKANKFFSFWAGYGKNSFGEGYRSLLLSDNAGPNPFAKIETSFAGIKYVNLYSILKDNTTDPFDRKQDITKFTSTHYLSWNITRNINFSVFETVVWQGKDTLTNRGLDINYLNPIVFYRPVEYGLGSSDNVLIGANSCYKFNNHHNVYGQFVLDEFLLSELKAKSKWWANKYGYQIGYKSNHFFAENLYFQLEFNGVRPFTYSHKSSQHSYGHLNAPLAHPIGANFYELLNIISYKKGRHRITNKITFASYGKDPDNNISYGQDIFKSYTLRDGNFGHLMMQGVKTNVLNENIIYEFGLWPEIDLFLTAMYNYRLVNNSYGTEQSHTFSVGIRSRIWNSYSDF